MNREQLEQEEKDLFCKLLIEGRVKERPILFNTPMVQAILDKRKTQTRRIIKPQPFEDTFETGLYHPAKIDEDGELYPGPETFGISTSDWSIKCPYGQIGDVLWVRETWLKCQDGYIFRADHFGNKTMTSENGKTFDASVKWKPSIHMPREACRLFLEITDIKVEMLQDISVEDAIAEGIIHKSMNCPKVEFQQLWQTVYGDESWESNPFVWVVEFKQVEK